MKREFKLLMLTGLCVAWLPIQAIAMQEINFRDLAKPGAPVSKRYTVDGIRSEGEQYIRRFGDSDDSRVQEYSARAQSYSNVAPPPQATKTVAKSSAKIFVCIVYCESGSGPIVKEEIQAINRAEAGRLMDENAHKACQAHGQKYASNIRFDERQCSEK